MLSLPPNLRSTYKEPPSWRFFGSTHSGTLLLEGIVAIGIFAIFLGGIGVALVVGERSTVIGGDRGRAAFLASEQIQGLRRIQIQDFDALTTPGVYGVIEQGSAWSLGSTPIVKDGFTSRITLTNVSDSEVSALATVSWNFGMARSGSVMVRTHLTDWRAVTTVGNWASVSQASSTLQSGSPGFQEVMVAGNYAFIASTAGDGLYIYDISSLSSPVRVSSSFSLGASAYDLAIAGNRLFVVTGDTAREVIVMDITSPTTLSSGSVIEEFDLTGTAGARSVAVYGNWAFVGTADSVTDPHFIALEIDEDTGELDLLSSLSTSGGILGLSLSDGYAYAASTNNAAEFQVVDIIEPEDVQYAPGMGVDMTDSQDAISMVTSGTSAVIGRGNGSAIEEVTLYTIGDSPVPVTPPGPWSIEIGGSANALTLIDGTKYLFVGNDSSSAELRVVDLFALKNGASATLTTANLDAGIQGLFYDWARDKLFAVTASNRLIIFSPN
ncbi:MAG: hypothetical protein ABL890_02925 [Candidatus Peribacteraceae bacterium]